MTFFNKYVYLQQKGAIYTTPYIIYKTLPKITAIGRSGYLQTIYNTLIHFIVNGNYIAYGESTTTTEQTKKQTKKINSVYTGLTP